MLKISIYLKRILIAASAFSVISMASTSRATISVKLSPTVTPAAGEFFDWSYDTTFINSYTQKNESRITIFDFEGYVPGFEVTPFGWTFTTAPTGPALLSDAAQLAVPSHTDLSIPHLI
ncbi:hypothetical protein QEH56_09695 [Pelagicoccus enzymogenes]|uniref:hypothetical protein n=1 Tax=Pelagicoccus enzymogenes TaxID=2773457 RepID=UPI00280CEC0C|nr:hypothetical protein [Pelagicoccus enzymogenes]MDQ8198420.1 hypothetical protein [Pelagicoccus enzymogenes]